MQGIYIALAILWIVALAVWLHLCLRARGRSLPLSMHIISWTMVVVAAANVAINVSQVVAP